MSRDLNSFGLLKISGPDAMKFLQGQLTCNMEKILPGESALAAHCNPQGRIISLFYIFNHADNYYLFMQKSMLAIALEALKKYAVFFTVTISEADEDIADKAIASFVEKSHQQIITQHIPTIYPQTTEKFLPHELSLQKLNALDFDKGCFTGQEIIARMHYRAKIKSNLCRYQLLSKNQFDPGVDIYTADNQACGTIVDTWQADNKNYVLCIMNDSNSLNTDFSTKEHMTFRMNLISQVEIK